MKTIGIVLVSLIIVSCASFSQRENPVARAILEKGSVRELGLLEELHYQDFDPADDYASYGIREYWVHAEYPFVEEFYPILDHLIGGSNWYPQEGNGAYIRRIGDSDFPVDIFTGIDMDRLDALTEEYGVVFWQSDPENLFISIRDMATFQEQLDSNPLLRQMLDRIARNPYPGSTGIDTDPERSSSDPDVNNIRQIALETLQYDTLMLVNDPEISKYAFFYFIPSSIKDEPDIRTVVVGNGLPRYESYDDLATSMTHNARSFAEYCQQHGYAMIKLLVPGLAQYMLSEYLFTDPSDSDPLARPDLEIRNIILGFLGRAEASSLQMHHKVFFTGFSNGGIQSNVFPLLHPDMVEASAVGAAGAYTMPLARYEGRELSYPLGIANIGQIPGVSWSLDEYLSVEHFIFVGEDDINNDPGFVFRADLDFYMENFGTTTVDRVPRFAEILGSIGGSAEYRLYPGVGHSWIDEMYEDSFAFFNSVPLSGE
jgi:hypothetical protein